MHNHTSMKDAVYASILEDILSHEYRPNDILNEKKLVDKYGYSKTPVREALISLCNDNVLRSIPRYGYEVVRLTLEDVRDMLQFRYVLESGLLAANSGRFTENQIGRLVAIDEKCNSADSDMWEHWALNSEFHLKMIGFCNNNYAINELEKCMDRLKRAYAQFYWDNLETASFSLDTRNHSLIIQALRENDIEGLLRRLKDDINDFGGSRYSFGLEQ